MISKTELEPAVRKTVSLYNRLKSPQVFAKVVHVSNESVTISFSGPFCYNCSVPLVFIEDFVKNLEVFTDKVKLEIGVTKQTSANSFEVDFAVKPLQK